MSAAMSRESAVAALNALIGTKAVTVQDKYQLLEQRDKILRKVRHRVHDVHQATVFIGTCPDMCPEKERYEREVQKRLSVYEVVQPLVGAIHDAAVNHRRAVKDYGRSAADQEEPLPHELRSAPVLDMTMCYLLTEIAFNESADSQLPGWYDFLWKRTRAIRKDMTQQMLEGDVAISLLEKCARFHAFCAHRLCELDIGEFDQKMNTENLTKCLQSLKHMYEDMSKKGLACGNEAEFRSYDVLLSLNDTDVLRHILTYDPHVRKSAHVRFALKLSSAMQNNNYVEFFRLVRRRATYLQACLAHRYFDEVRDKAMRTLLRSSGTNPRLQVDSLVRLLGFENDEEAVKFGVQHGLTTDPKDGYTLVLNRWAAGEAEEEQTILLKRSFVLVEAKRKGNLGDILNGGPISQVTLPSPLVSFDEQHYYRNDKVINDFMQSGHVEEEKTRVVEAAVPMVSHERNGAQEATVAVAKAILDRTVCSIVSESGIIELERAKSVNWIMSNVIASILRKSAGIILDREKERILQLRRQENLRKSIAAFRENVFCKIVDDVVQSAGQQLAKDVRSEIFRTKAADRALKFALQVRDKIVEASIREQVSQLCTNYYQKEIQSPLEKLNRIKENLSNITIRRYFLRWRNTVFANVYRRKVLDDFPSCPTEGHYDNDEATPPKKRVRFALGSTLSSPYNWPEILEARNFLTQQTSIVLETTVISILHKVAASEIRKQELWNLRFSKDQIMMAVGPRGLSEYENAKTRIFSDFLPQSRALDYENGNSPNAVGWSRKKDASESVYSWMDEIKGPAAHQNSPSAATAASPTRKTTVAKSQVDQASGTDIGRQNFFSEISLTPSAAFRQETMEIARRLRSTVQSEKRVGEEELASWTQVLDCNNDRV